jgi:hypothetical protein
VQIKQPPVRGSSRVCVDIDGLFSKAYSFNKARQLDGTMDKGSRYGSYCLTAARVWMGWGAVAQHRWPRPQGPVEWPPNEPPGLDQIARFNRTFCHFRIRNISDARRSLSLGNLFRFSVPMTRAWYAAPNGLIPMPVGPHDFVEGHAVEAAGYDDNTQLLTFINSWGPDWGNGGIGYLPYSYFQTYLSDAWVMFPRKLKNWLPRDIPDTFGIRASAFTNGLANAGALIDLWQIDQDVRIGWCVMTYRGAKFLEIEDFFIRPDFQSGGFQEALTEEVLDFSRQQQLPLKLWIAHADTRYFASNFKPINEFLRATNLTARPSPFPWAAYLAQ